MGVIGMSAGFMEAGIGVLSGNFEHVKQGYKRMAIGLGTTLLGDVVGVSDTIGIISPASEYIVEI